MSGAVAVRSFVGGAGRCGDGEDFLLTRPSLILMLLQIKFNLYLVEYIELLVLIYLILVFKQLVLLF
jgi:hypothetical protein